MIYEYAGFKFVVNEAVADGAIQMVPVPGQHRAAYKD